MGLILTLAFGLLSTPLAADAQPATKVPRIGLLSSLSPADAPQNTDAIRQGLRDLGWIEGQNILIDYRWAEGKVERIADLAAELVRLKVAVIIASSSSAVLAASNTTRTIPVVALDLETDPVASGLAASLAQPDGNITGVFLDLPELSGKLLELLREAVPNVTRIAILWDAAMDPLPLRATEVAARSLGVSPQILEVRSADELESAFGAATRGGAKALMVLQSPRLFAHQPRIADLAATHRLPTIAMFREFADAGGLMSYGPNIKDIFRRAASFIDKILKGSKPGDLPIERPLRFDLVINLKTAQALGLTIPTFLLFQANEVLQ
jgi:putative tryptophan/tyrosine transport system substrate-binding protein